MAVDKNAAAIKMTAIIQLVWTAETSVSKKTFEKEDVANPNAASKILKESEKMKRVADEKLKEEAEQLKAVPQ